MTKKCPLSFNNPNYQGGMECIREACEMWVPAKPTAIPKTVKGLSGVETANLLLSVFQDADDVARDKERIAIRKAVRECLEEQQYSIVTISGYCGLISRGNNGFPGKLPGMWKKTQDDYATLS